MYANMASLNAWRRSRGFSKSLIPFYDEEAALIRYQTPSFSGPIVEKRVTLTIYPRPSSRPIPSRTVFCCERCLLCSTCSTSSRSGWPCRR
jgi:hypothetical protein